MAYPRYSNIDGAEAVTPWQLLALGAYPSVYGWSDTHIQRVTTVAIEVPRAYDGLLPYDNYWINKPYYKTKLDACANFRTIYPFVAGTLHVYLNGTEIPAAHIQLFGDAGDENRFVVLRTLGDVTLIDGALTVSYLPATESIAIGDGRAVMEGYGIYGELLPVAITPSFFDRLHVAVNTAEAYLGIAPTIWTGGPYSNITGGHLIPGESRIYYTVIRELQDAITRIESRVDALLPAVVGHYAFSAVSAATTCSILLIEELLEAFRYIEAYIIANISGANVS